MPGIISLIANSKIRVLPWNAYLASGLYNESYKTKVVSQSVRSLLALSYYEGYPFSVWQKEGVYIVLEGMVYNKSRSEIESRLTEIARCFIRGDEYQGLVTKFVESADGDYIVEIWQDNMDKLLVFNDYFGRLPIYYFCQNGYFGLSREIKGLLSFIPQIRLNKSALVEFISFEFPLGNKTLFENVYRLNPSEMLAVRGAEAGIELQVSQTTDFNFSMGEPLSTRENSLSVLRDLFLESTKNRVVTLEQDGYRLIADLSGGYDTRTIMAGLSKFTQNVSYFSQKLATGDEREWGERIYNALGGPGKFNTAAPNHSFRIDELGPFLFECDGLVNFYTAYTSYQNVKALRDLVPEKAARFMGFGGEFIRHPFISYSHSLIEGIDRGLYSYSNVPLANICKIMGVNYDEYYQELEAYLNTYPEETPQGQLRRFYYEYYNHYVNAAGEDRWRTFFWTVQPLWGLNFVHAIFTKVPLHWTGYKYFIQFMKSMDQRLLQVPIFMSNIQLGSNINVDLFEKRHRVKTWINSKSPALRNIYRSLREKKKAQIAYNELSPHIQDAYHRLSHIEFPPGDGHILSKSTPVSRRYLTLLMYLLELEQRYNEKL